jgi:hypothetical protein
VQDRTGGCDQGRDEQTEDDASKDEAVVARAVGAKARLQSACDRTTTERFTFASEIERVRLERAKSLERARAFYPEAVVACEERSA